jgi:hypothetical protein
MLRNVIYVPGDALDVLEPLLERMATVEHYVKNSLVQGRGADGGLELDTEDLIRLIRACELKGVRAQTLDEKDFVALVLSHEMKEPKYYVPARDWVIMSARKGLLFRIYKQLKLLVACSEHDGEYYCELADLHKVLVLATKAGIEPRSDVEKYMVKQVIQQIDLEEAKSVADDI